MNKLKLFVLSAAAAIPAASMLGASALGANLITNGQFTSNANGWDNYGGNPVAQNGYLKVQNTYTGNGNSYYGAWYCVTGIEAGKSYTASVETYVSKFAPANTGAALQLHYYGGNSCNGSSVSGGEYEEIGKLDADRGHWVPMAFSQVVPNGAHSVRVRVSAIKEPVPYGSAITKTTSVYFDNAYYGRTTVVKPGLDIGGVLVNPTVKPPTPTPTPGILVNPTVNPPTPTPTPGILVNPTVNPPTPTPTPTDVPQDDPEDQPQDEPGDQPQDEPDDDPQGDPQDQPTDEPQDNPQTNDDSDDRSVPIPSDNDTPSQGAPGGAGEVPTTPPAAPDTGNTGDSNLVTPVTGVGFALTALGFGGGAVALAFALRRRRQEEDE
ncbi:MAG: hypothetical protein AB7N24_05065 [Dehalococcoidia bacterium]